MLPKFSAANMSKKCRSYASFNIENQLFQDSCFGSLMTDGFLG